MWDPFFRHSCERRRFAGVDAFEENVNYIRQDFLSPFPARLGKEE